MMNNAVFGGEEARAALAREQLKLHQLDKDWCVDTNDCVPWKKQGAIGLQRHQRLRERYAAHGKKP